MDASSPHTSASKQHTTPATAYAMSACGPAGVVMRNSSAHVMNGPVPNMFSAFSAHAWEKFHLSASSTPSDAPAAFFFFFFVVSRTS